VEGFWGVANIVAAVLALLIPGESQNAAKWLGQAIISYNNWREVVVGNDGVLLTRKDQERFVRWETIEDVRGTKTRLVFDLVGGETLELSTYDKGGACKRGGYGIAKMIDSRRRAALDIPELDAAAALSMSQKTSEWLRGQVANSYRRAAQLPAQLLLEVAEHPRADVAVRAAAAVALRNNDGGEAKRVLDRLAEITADVQSADLLRALARATGQDRRADAQLLDALTERRQALG